MSERSLVKHAAVGSTPTLVKLVFHRVRSKVADTLSPKRDAGVQRRIVNSKLLKNNGSFTIHYQIITYCSNNSVTSQVYTNDMGARSYGQGGALAPPGILQFTLDN